MGKLSRIYCLKCGFKLRRLEIDRGKKKKVLYECILSQKIATHFRKWTT